VTNRPSAGVGEPKGEANGARTGTAKLSLAGAANNAAREENSVARSLHFRSGNEGGG
jgi:hypothetical protein